MSNKKKIFVCFFLVLIILCSFSSCLNIGFVATYPDLKVNYKNGDSYGKFTASYENTIYYLCNDKDKSFVYSMDVYGNNCVKMFEVSDIRSIAANKNYVYFLGRNEAESLNYDLFCYNKLSKKIDCIRKIGKYIDNLFATDESVIVGGDNLLLKIDLSNNSEKILFKYEDNKSKLIENSNKLNKNLENVYSYEDEYFIVFFELGNDYVSDYQVYQKNSNTLVMRKEVGSSYNTFGPLLFNSKEKIYSYRNSLYKINGLDISEKIFEGKLNNYQRISIVNTKDNITRLLLQNYKQNFFHNEGVVAINNDSEIVIEKINPTKGITILFKDEYGYILENGKISKYDYTNESYIKKDIFDISKYVTKYVTLETCKDWIFIYKVENSFSNDEIPKKLLCKINAN